MNGALLTDAHLRKGLAAARALGRAGVPVAVAAAARVYPAAFSRYVFRVFRYAKAPEPAELSEQLRELLARTDCRVLLPLDDLTANAAVYGGEMVAHAAVLPPPDRYRQASDKGEACRFAAQMGLPIPRTEYVSAIRDETAFLTADRPFPVAIKPRRSSGSRGIRIARDRAELTALYRQIAATFPRPLLQEFIPPGDRFDVCLLYNREGKLRASFVQRELRHFPLPRGPSTVQESVVRDDLLAWSDALMRALDWRGIAEVEWMIDPRDGAPKLMEINPRFWNSLHLAVVAGVNFPLLYYRIAADGDCEPVHDYRAGVRCRSLLPEDTLCFLADRRRRDMDPPFWPPVQDGLHDELLCRDDPWPMAGLVLQWAAAALDPNNWRDLLIR